MQIEQNLRELWATFIALFRMAGISDYIDIALVAYLIYRAMKLCGIPPRSGLQKAFSFCSS